MNKDLLFFSNYDDYSKKIIGIIKTNNIIDIVPICIDDSKIKIPSYITVVPTLYINKSKKILIDENLNKYIESKMIKENKTIDTLDGYNNMSFSNDYHNIDLDNHDHDDNNLSVYFSDINSMKDVEKLDEQQILNNRASNIDSLQKSRQTDLSNIFNK